VTFQSLRSIWAAIVLGFITAVLLSSCGGGGAAQTTTGGALQLLPGSGSAYGGVPFTFQIVGGRPPYTISSSEPGLMPVPSSVSGSSFTVLPANPGVVDAGLPPDALPVRTVNVTARDSNGNSITSTIKVGINFFTGYGISFSNSSCPASSSGSTAGLVCAGQDSVMLLSAVFNGNLYGGREYRIDVLQGNFILVNPATGASGQSVQFTTDHVGNVTAIVRVAGGINSQLGVIKVTDVATQTSTIETFSISGNTVTSNGALTAIPSTFTFTGPDNQTCGSGQGSFFVFDGMPPYTAFATNPGITVNFIDPNHTPGRFGVVVGPTGGGTCPTGSIVVTDANNNRATISVTSAKGTAAPPVVPTPLSVQPNSITLGCAQSGSVSVIGGSGSTSGGTGGGSAPTYSVSSADPNVTATVTGNTVTITRAGPAGAGTGTSTSSVVVTDGSQVQQIAVTAPTTCP
jgi:hypothetical protein